MCIIKILLIIAINCITVASSSQLESNCEFIKTIADMRLVCRNKNASNIAASVDSAKCPFSRCLKKLYVELSSIRFPDGRIKSKWYKGIVEMFFLDLHLDNVTAIEDNAFNTHALRLLDKLIINLRTHTEFYAGMFNGLENLKWLIISGRIGSYFCQTNAQLLKPIIKLELFYNLHGNVSFQDYFGTQNLTRLYNITVGNPMSVVYSRILSNEDFAGLCAVISLLLNNCGIEAILEGTFDFIGGTLRDLDLGLNKIKHLAFGMLFKFFDSRAINGDSHKVLHLGDNLFQCNCEFYLLKNVTLISFGHRYIADRYIRCNSKLLIVSNETCDDIQIIHPERMHLTYPYGYVRPYAYVKFQLKLVRDQRNVVVRVRQFEARRYRLWIHNLNEPHLVSKLKCPNKVWLTESIKCFTFAKREVNISIERFLQKSSHTIFCIVFLRYPEKVWPLHCTTVFKAIPDSHSRWMSVANLVWICFLGILTGIAMRCIWYTCGKRSDRARVSSICSNNSEGRSVPSGIPSTGFVLREFAPSEESGIYECVQ